MLCSHRWIFGLVLVAAGVYAPPARGAEAWESTRVTDAKQYAGIDQGGYASRKRSDFVLKELDLRPGDVVVDIGAGEGWWAEKMAAAVGPTGVVHASEVEQKKVDQMKQKFTDLPQVKPYLCPTDGTALPEHSCDLAFLSQTYHHLKAEGRVDYLRHLRKVLKPTGRLCVIEKEPQIAAQQKDHAIPLGRLVEQAAEAGWVAVRCQYLAGTNHYLAIFVPQDLFAPPK